MRNTKPNCLCLIALGFAVLFTVSACSEKVAPEIPKIEEGEAAAIVNGEKVYVSDVELEAVARGLISAGTAFGPDHPDYKMVLDQTIDQKLMAQEAIKRGLETDPAAARRLAMARERILGNLLVESLIASEVTDETIEAVYADQVRLQQLNDQVSLAYILLETKDDADAVYEELQAGASFESMVRSRSQDMLTRMENGDLGYVRPEEMEAPYPAIIAETVTGAHSKPFKASNGWHILKVKDRRTAPPKTREEMRPEIVTFLTLNEISDLLRVLRVEALIQEGQKGERIEPATPYSLPDGSRDVPAPSNQEGSTL